MCAFIIQICILKVKICLDNLNLSFDGSDMLSLIIQTQALIV